MKSPALWLNLVGELKISNSGMTNTALKNICRWISNKKREGINLSHLRSMIIGAEPIEPAILKESETVLSGLGMPVEALNPAYGMAEAALGVSFLDKNEKYKLLDVQRDSLSLGRRIIESDITQDQIVSLGHPVDGLSIKILNEDGAELEKGSVGFISLKGKNISQGYWTSAGFQKSLDAQGYFTTKDLGFFKDDQLFILGRSQEVFYVDGRNLFLNDIDRIVNESGLVRTSGCAAVMNPIGKQDPDSVTVLVDIVGPEPEDTIEKIRDLLKVKLGFSSLTLCSVPGGTFFAQLVGN